METAHPGSAPSPPGTIRPTALWAGVMVRAAALQAGRFVRPALGRVLRMALLAAGLAALAACAGLIAPVLKEPTVSLEEARVIGADLEQADLLFDFRVGNPNGVALPLAGIEYELLVNGARFLDGAQDRRVDIAAHGESRVELPVTLRYRDLVAAFRSLRDGERSDYEIRADFLFDVPLLGRVRVPVKERGDLPLPGLSITR